VSLFRYDASNDRLMTPWFAESYEISTDGKNYTVTIKPRMKFQDGSPFTVDDVVFSYKVYYHDFFDDADGIMNNESVHKIDARSLMMSVGFDYNDLIYNLDTDTYNSYFFNVTLLSPSSSPIRHIWSVYLDQSLPKIGIGVTEHVNTGWGEIVPRTFGWSSNTLVPLWDDGGYDIFFIGYRWSFDYDPQYLYDTYGLCDTGSCDNWYNFVNTIITDLVDLYVRELDNNARITLAHQIQDFLKVWRPVIPSIYPQPTGL